MTVSEKLRSVGAVGIYSPGSNSVECPCHLLRLVDINILLVGETVE